MHTNAGPRLATLNSKWGSQIALPILTSLRRAIMVRVLPLKAIGQVAAAAARPGNRLALLRCGALDPHHTLAGAGWPGWKQRSVQLVGCDDTPKHSGHPAYPRDLNARAFAHASWRFPCAAPAMMAELSSPTTPTAFGIAPNPGGSGRGRRHHGVCGWCRYRCGYDQVLCRGRRSLEDPGPVPPAFGPVTWPSLAFGGMSAEMC